MSKGPDVLERSCLPAGKVFIRTGEENARAYVIQDGEVIAFTMHEDQKVEIDRFGPGTIIGERSLVIDEPERFSYEATTPTTVITITRQDFQKRLVKAGKSVKTVLDHAVNKIIYYENIELNKARKRAEIDDAAFKVLGALLNGMSADKKFQYEKALLPHVNGLVRELKELKKRFK